jgi:hypothetical protein
MTSSTGTCAVMYDQAGDANYNAAPEVTETVNPGKTDQTIAVTTHAPASAVYGSQFTVAANAPGGSIAYSSSGSCTNSGATFTNTNASGTCTVKYDQAGRTTTAPEVTETVTAVKADLQSRAPPPVPYRVVTGPRTRRAADRLLAAALRNSGRRPPRCAGTCTVRYDRRQRNYNCRPR